jgi:nucleotide-binding universal stress UspA family protein
MDMQESFTLDASGRMEELKAEFGLSTEEACVLQLGNPKYVVTGYAKEHGVDWVICGSHGKHGAGLLLGSTSNAIVHQAQCDVLTIRLNEAGECVRPVGGEYRRVMLATDFYEDASVVIKAFLAMSGENKSDASLVTVTPDAAMLAMTYMPDLEGEIVQKVRKQVEAFQEKHGLKQAHTRVCAGQPKVEILRAAKEFHSDLIVLGSHGRGAVMSFFLGSTANAVLHGAESDVLIVRIPS